VQVVDHREVLALLEEGGRAVEVLGRTEYCAVHLRGAIHLPLPRLWREASTLLEPDRAVIVYCRDSL